ncbi:MAG: HDOD domain-containing protein [Candidatus Cloacimonetes bacterium]|nr:HDOD domain-containing protein [Candidatus Cloacimonadota bacterium]
MDKKDFSNYSIPSSLPKPSLGSLEKTISSISAIPVIALKILEVTQNPKSTVAQLESLIKSDTSLSTNLLRLVNSSYFGLNQSVVDIHKAIVLMGLKTVRDLALASSICPLFSGESIITNYSRINLWKHSVCVAIASRMVARRIDSSLDESLFTMGIIHDLGILLLDLHAHVWFELILTHPEYQQLGLEGVEKELLGFTHHDLIQIILKKWQFPPMVVEAVAFHLQPSRSLIFSQQTAILYLANCLANRHGLGYTPHKNVKAEEFNHVLKVLNLGIKDIHVLMDDLPGELVDGNNLLIMIEDM